VNLLIIHLQIFQFRTYRVRAKDVNNEPIRFRFCDTMGLEGGDNGLRAVDVAKIMDGNVQDGTDVRTFNNIKIIFLVIAIFTNNSRDQWLQP
jgi:hypothetical protein